MNKQEFVFDNGVTISIDEKVNHIGEVGLNNKKCRWFFLLSINGREVLVISSPARKRGEGKRQLQLQKASFISWLNIRKNSDA